MEKIGLLIDSTTLTRDNIIKIPYVKVAPLGVTIDGVNYNEFELSIDQMNYHIHHAKKMLTSQPSPGEFLRIYQEYFDEGYTHVLVLTLSEKISGTFQSALLAKSMIDFPLEVSIHAPKVASFGVALGLPLIQDLIEKGTSFEDVVKNTILIYDHAAVMFTLQNLMNLFRGGRLGIASALIGTVLRIKPVVEMIEGKLVLTKKERTNIACYEYFMSSIEEYVKNYKTVYVDFIELNKLEFANRFLEETKVRFPNVITSVTHYVSPVFAVHLGDVGFGIAVIAI